MEQKGQYKKLTWFSAFRRLFFKFTRPFPQELEEIGVEVTVTLKERKTERTASPAYVNSRESEGAKVHSEYLLWPPESSSASLLFLPYWSLFPQLENESM